MNRIPDERRAQITAIVARVISELAGADYDIDQEVAQTVIGVINVCCQAHVSGDHRAAIGDAVDLTTEKDWLFTVKKLENSFEFEVAFGNEMKAAKLKESMRWVSKAGIN